VLQFALFALLAAGPRTLPGLPPWPPLLARAAAAAGAVLVPAGCLVSLAGVLRLGANLSPLPFPKEGASLVVGGAYRYVRHPIYSGLICAALGWGLWLHGWLTLGYAALLFALLDLKSRREERWLCERFAGYDAYQRRVRRLIPFVY
jgi:protein-S-isoprenylcysteine O-methyltransferase Ste14